jgi:hypothetical protein
VKTSQKALMNKVMSMLLFVSLITTITGSAVASSAAEQGQSCQLCVTRDGVTCDLSQAQFAVVENGVATAYQVQSIIVVKDKYGKIKSVNVKLRQVEKGSSSSTVDSAKVIESSQYQDANCVVTTDSANINLNQAQVTCENSNGVIKQVEVMKVRVKFLKDGTIKVVIKMKQKQIAK